MTSSSAPMKTLNDDISLAAGGRRFRFVPLRDRLAATTARPSALPALPASTPSVSDKTFSHFRAALDERRELDLTAAFTAFADATHPLSHSLPLVFTARARIVSALDDALVLSTPAAPSLAACLHGLARDLGAAFLPYFPTLVAAIARCLGDGREMWEPDAALVPLLGALARVVKILVQPLVRAPDDTLAALEPLLAHGHYRIREMAAEASAGYLLRKTRDAAAAQALCAACLGRLGANKALVDGVTAALYEGTRAVRGGLHPSAVELLNFALAEVGGLDVSDNRFAAVANALAALRQRTVEKGAVADMTSALLEMVEGAAEEGGNSSLVLENSLYLLKKWCGHRGGAWVTEAHFQRALALTVDVTTSVPARSDRAVFEALALVSAVLAVQSTSLSGGRYQSLNMSARTSLVSATSRVADSLVPVALATLRDALEARAVSVRDVLDVYAQLCERAGRDAGSPAGLEHAVLLLRYVVAPVNSGAGRVLVSFPASTLTAFVNETLRQNPPASLSDASGGRGRILLALEFCRLAEAPSCVPALRGLVDGWVATAREDGGGSMRSCAALALDALVGQQMSSLTVENSADLVDAAVRLVNAAPGELGALRALCVLLASFPLIRSEEEVEALIETVAVSLSSGVREVRCQAATLLPLLQRSLDSGSGAREALPRVLPSAADDSDDEEDAEDGLSDLFRRMEQSADVATVFDAVLAIVVSPLTVDRSSSCQQLILALSGLVQRKNAAATTRSMCTVLSNLAVGLFRTKFKLLWKSAGELWCAVAFDQPKIAWLPVKEALLVTKGGILKMSRHGPGADSDDNHAEENEEEHGSGDGGVDGEDAVDSGKSTVSAEAVGSKRKRDDVGDTDVGNEEEEEEEALASTEREERSVVSKFPIPKRARRDQAKGLISLRWSLVSWEEDIIIAQASAATAASAFVVQCDVAEDMTDDVVLHREVLLAISKQPAVAMNERLFVIRDLCLPLNPVFMSRKLGNSMVRSYAVLLEKLGGLKGTGNDADLERKLRQRLMDDICRPDSACQAAAVKALCAGRSPVLKSFRASLLRLIDDGTFRDELALLTTKLREDGALVDDSASAKDNGLQDVLVRICFAKMRGRRDRLGSRRGAVLGFIVSTLSWSEAVPRLISLAIAPISSAVSSFLKKIDSEKGPVNYDEKCARDFVFPPSNVFRGILYSLEAIVQQFGVAIPEQSWRMLVASVYLMLEATNDVSAKTVRALTLRRLALMVDKRPVETEFIARRVVSAVRRGRFDATSAADITDAPALLVFLASCARAPLPMLHSSLVRNESWAFSWSLGVISSEKARSAAVDLALEVSQVLAKEVALDLISHGECSELDGELVTLLPSSLRSRLNLFQDLMARDGRLGKWRIVLEHCMALVGVLGDCGLNLSDAKTLVNALSEFVVAHPGRCHEAIEATLLAMAKLFQHICDAGGGEEGVRSGASDFVASHAMALSRLMNDRFVVGETLQREALCKALTGLGQRDLLVVAGFLSQMDAMRSDRINEPDYDVRLGTISVLCKSVKTACETGDGVSLGKSSIASSRFDSRSAGKKKVVIEADEECGDDLVDISVPGICALVRSCLWTLKDEDSAARGTAGFALSLFAKYVSARAESALADEVLAALVVATVEAPVIGERREVCSSLGELVRCSMSANCFSPSALLESLQFLARPDNLDVDFFENIAHLQPHRRSRALRRLSSVFDSSSEKKGGDEDACEQPVLPASSVLRVLATEFAVPLSYRITLDVSEEAEKKPKHAKSMEARDAVRADVGIWAAKACGAAAAVIDHREYRIVLTRIIRRLPREDNEMRLDLLYSLLVSIASAFPLSNEDGERSEEMAAYLSKTALPQMLKHVTAGGVEGDLLESVMAGHTKRGQGGIGKSGTRNAMVFRAPVAIAAAKLMTRMKEEEMEISLPLLITPVASALRSRMTDVRDGAKKALVKLVVLLGSNYLPYVVQQVLQVLEKGFRKDAGVYVLHALLLGVQNARKQHLEERRPVVVEMQDIEEVYLPIDAGAGMIADALRDEIVEGVSSNSKDFDNPNVSTSRARDAANRATRAADAAELLAEMVDFKKSAQRVVKPFRDAVVSASSSKLASRLENTLQRILLGLVRNESLNARDGLRFSHEMVHDHMPFPVVDDDSAVVKSSAVKMDSRRFTNLPRGHVIVEFGLGLLNSFMSKSVVKADGNSASALEMRSMLEPFLPEVGLALKSRFDSLTLIGLKVTQRLVRLPLKGRSTIANDLTGTVLQVLSRRGVGKSHGQKQAGTSNCQDLFHACLRVASVIVQEVGKGGGEGGGGSDNIREETVRQLLVISRECLDEGSVEMRNAALAFVRSVVAAKFKTPEIYDAVDDVSKLAVRGQSAGLQSSCITVSVAFLVNYPLSSKRIRQQLEFYVRNLNYEHPEGRLAALRALATVINKFPTKSLGAESEFLFLPLVAVIANDAEVKCREEASQTLRALFTEISDARKVSEMIGMSMTLLGVKADSNCKLGFSVNGSTDLSLQKAGAAALGAAVGSGVLSKSQIMDVLFSSLSVGLAGCDLGEEIESVDANDESDAQPWDLTYEGMASGEQALDALEKVVNDGRVEVMAALQPFWGHMPAVLSHQHVWVRLIACRLLGRHFSAVGDDLLLTNSAAGTFSLFNGPAGSVRSVIKALCLILEGAVLSEALAQQTLKNLLFLGNAVRLHPSVGHAGVGLGAEGSEDEAEVDAEGGRHVSDNSEINRGLYWLLRRMSGMAIRAGQSEAALLRRACAVRFLAAAVASWGLDAVKPYLRLFVGPAMRILESKAPILNGGTTKTANAQASAAAIRSMAETMQDLLVKALGADEYYVLYNELRTQRRADQVERKRKYAVEAAVDPERAEKKRVKRNIAKSKARKRKANDGTGRGGYSWRVAHASAENQASVARPLTDG